MKAYSRGFTLIEVMVALFILALTFIGVIGTASYVSRTIDTLQEKTVALWVAQNAISEINLGVWGDIHEGFSPQNDMKIAGKLFQWKSIVITEDHYYRVTVSVFPAKNPNKVAEVVYYASR